MINVMQIIVKMPLMNLTFPQNAATFYSFVNDISTSDLIPTEGITDTLFSFTEVEVSDPNFVQMGYESASLIQNMGSLAYYMMGVAAMVGCTLVLWCIKRRFKM
jgi:hypothetical protein